MSCRSRTYLQTDHAWSGRAVTSLPGTGTIMAISIKRAQQLAEDGELPVDEVIKTLYESEGVQGCRRVTHVGHPLQHVAVLLRAGESRKDKPSRRARTKLNTARGQLGATPLEQQYWMRGPGNAGIKHHSMFPTDDDAGLLIRDALCGEGGLRTLRYLGITDEVTVCLGSYLQHPFQMIRREGDQASEAVFTYIHEITTLIVLVLHSRCGTLHIQTAFPTHARRHDEGNLIPEMQWELEWTDRVTGQSDLVRPNLAPGALR